MKCHSLRALIGIGSGPGARAHLCTLPASFVRPNLPLLVCFHFTLPVIGLLSLECPGLSSVTRERVNRAQSKLHSRSESEKMMAASSHRFPVALTREESKRPGLERGLSDDGISQMFLQSQSKALEQKMSFFHYALSLLAGKSL